MHTTDFQPRKLKHKATLHKMITLPVQIKLLVKLQSVCGNDECKKTVGLTTLNKKFDY